MIRVTTSEFWHYSPQRDQQCIRVSYFHNRAEYFAVLPQPGEVPRSEYRRLRERFRDEVLPEAIRDGRSGDLTKEVIQ